MCWNYGNHSKLHSEHILVDLYENLTRHKIFTLKMNKIVIWAPDHMVRTTTCMTFDDLGEPTHTLVPCWMPEPLPPRNQCTSCFAPADCRLANHIVDSCEKEGPHLKPAYLVSTRLLFLGGRINDHHGKLGFQECLAWRDFATWAPTQQHLPIVAFDLEHGWTEIASVNHQSRRRNLR